MVACSGTPGIVTAPRNLRTTNLYDPTNDQLTLDEIAQISTRGASCSMTTTPQTPGYMLSGPAGTDILAEHRDPRQQIMRIRALLAEWLRMENVVVLIGSGASVARGGLLLDRLEEKVLEIVEARCKQMGRTASIQLLDQRRSSRATGPQFEEWLSYLSNVRFLLSNEASPITSLQWEGHAVPPSDEFEKVMRDIERSIHALCSLALPEPMDERTAHHALVAKLIARDAALGRSHVFTLNYDTLIEQAFDQLAIQYMDGFVGTVQRRFDPSCYGLDIYYPGDTREGRVRRFDKFAHLYKLHGSVNWRLSSAGRVIQSSSQASSQSTAWRGLGADEQARQLDDFFPEGSEPIAILPTANKFVQTLDLPYAHLFRALHNRLHESQTFLLVLGYGFGDAHLNRIIDDAMNNPSLVLLVVDPRPRHATVERLKLYQDTGERAFLLSPQDQSGPVSACAFDDFAQNLLPQIQWLDDLIRLRKVEKTLHDSAGPTTGGAEDAL